MELCFEKISDAYNYYTKVLGEIIEYSTINRGNLTQTKSTNKSKDIKLDDVNFSIDSIKEEDKYIIEEADEKEEIIPEIEKIEIEDDNDDFEISLEEIKIEDEDIEEEEEDSNEDDKSNDTSFDENEEKVNDVNEIPTSIFNFDDTIGYDDEIEDDE